MGLFRFALATTLATFFLLLVGGTVNPTGSSLACPDWPTCYGSFFPEMKDGVEYEHTHRVVASAVGLMTAVLGVWIWRAKREDRVARIMGVAAFAMVVLQGVLGGVTVLLRLPLSVSTAHLGLSMFFFGFLIVLTARLWPSRAPALSAPHPVGRAWTGLATAAVYVQILLGALVRHTKSGRVCNEDFLLCDGVLWPPWGPAQLHMIHRFVGVLAAMIVIAAAVSAWKSARRNRIVSITAIAAPIIVSLQVLLGVLTVTSNVGLHQVTAHLGGAALLLADLVVLHLALGEPAHQTSKNPIRRAALETPSPRALPESEVAT